MPGTAGAASGIHKIRHVVVIMQENRSFDNYFGTFPGADGIPMRHGKPTVCLPDPLAGHCIRPHHDPHDVDLGQWHSLWSYSMDYDRGRMDGFARTGTVCLTAAGNPPCTPNPQTAIEAMGYHDQREIPNYWSYAKHFVLQDHMFEPTQSWSLPAHLYLVSEWSALCTAPGDPLSCHTNINTPDNPPDFGPPPHVAPELRLDGPHLAVPPRQHQLGLLRQEGPRTRLRERRHVLRLQGSGSQYAGHLEPAAELHRRPPGPPAGRHSRHERVPLRGQPGTLPAVSWVIPSGVVSEHPSSAISAGQSYVTNLIDTIALGPDWKSTAIFLAWDDWGGFYDNVKPPNVDGADTASASPRWSSAPTPGVTTSTTSSSASTPTPSSSRTISSRGQRLNPKTDGRPDPRPDVREDAPGLGDVRRDFNFNQKPRAPFILPTNPQQHG